MTFRRLSISPSGSDMMTDTSVSDDSDVDKWEFYSILTRLIGFITFIRRKYLITIFTIEFIL